MPRIILFNADDWGLSQRIHDAITGLHQSGALDAAGIMMGQPFTGQALEYASSNPSLMTGIHLFASDRDCVPLSMDGWPFLWPEDFWINGAVPLRSIARVVLEEVDAQLLAWKRTGLPLRFVNSHFHFHAHTALFQAVKDRIFHHFPAFSGWIRLGDSRPMRPAGPLHQLDPFLDFFESAAFQRDWPGRHNDTLFGIDTTFENSAPVIQAACQHLGEGFHEFFFHPGRSHSLADNGTDYSALLELAWLLPASVRGVGLVGA